MTKFRRPWLVALATASVALLALLEIHNGFSLWDEGFLWYGSQRVLHGEVPIRDFQAYDPARYYWSAAFMFLTRSDGVGAARLAAYAFQAIGISALLLSVKADRIRAERSAVALLVALMLLWMFPRHKLYDAAACLLMISGMAYWLRDRGTRASLLLGLLIGAAACVGRNHGLYGAVASAALLATYLKGHQRIAGLSWFALGVVIGYSPLLLMLWVSPQFATQFAQSITILFDIKATNLPISVPWPWTLTSDSSFRDVVVALHFLFLPLVCLVALATCFLREGSAKPMPSTMVASAFLSLPYAHFAFSRADVNHLAQGILPSLVFVALWILRLRPWRQWIGLALLSSGILVMMPMHPGWVAWREKWRSTDIAGECLKLPEATRLEMDALQGALKRLKEPGDLFVAAPYWPGAYALARQRSPMWEIYALVPRKPEFEQQEIVRIQAADPQLILLMDYPIDGMEERRLKRTHPLLYEYVTKHYSALPAEPGLAGTLLFTR